MKAGVPSEEWRGTDIQSGSSGAPRARCSNRCRSVLSMRRSVAGFVMKKMRQVISETAANTSGIQAQNT